MSELDCLPVKVIIDPVDQFFRLTETINRVEDGENDAFTIPGNQSNQTLPRGRRPTGFKPLTPGGQAAYWLTREQTFFTGNIVKNNLFGRNNFSNDGRGYRLASNEGQVLGGGVVIGIFKTGDIGEMGTGKVQLFASSFILAIN